MLDQAEWDAVWHAFRMARSEKSESLQAKLLRFRSQMPSTVPPDTINRQILFEPLKDAFEKVTGLKFEGDDPKVILHYRISFYGPPCPCCGRLLRNKRARQCFECGIDWHDPAKIVCRRK